MFIRKNFPLRSILKFSWFHIFWITIWAGIAVGLHQYTKFNWLAIPWLPISLIGTAVAFYLGFKNNSSYDRVWEARKIWGGIINSSRSLGSMVTNFVNNQYRSDHLSKEELAAYTTRILHRQIAWVYTLRQQLLVPEPWDHIGIRMARKMTRRIINKMNRQFSFEPLEKIHEKYLSKEEKEKLEKYANKATHLINAQTEDMVKLSEEKLINDLRHMELQKNINTFYDFQGKCERIKKFPFPRQYGSTSYYFVLLFILLIPFGMLSEFDKLGDGVVWLTVPFSTVVGWVFIMMELVGDYSQDPFENLQNDIPMYPLCRTIEIDLLEMLGDEDIPAPIKPVEGVLM